MTVRGYKYTAVLCFIGAFMGPFGGNVINVLVPRLQKDFAVSFYDISMSISLYMIAFASFQLISGLIADIMGRRNVVLFGYGVFGLGSLICYYATGLSVFLAGRFIQGMSNAFMTPVLMALLGDIVPKRSLGKYMGMFGSVQTSGIFLAPIVGGLFADINWRYVFIMLSLLSFVLAFIYYKTFSYTSREIKRKLMPASVYDALIGNKGVVLLSLSSFAGYFGFGSLGFLFAKYIHLNLKVSESINGILVSLTGLASIFFSPLAGRLIDKYDESKICMLGIIFIVPLIFYFPFVNNIYVLAALLFTMGGFSAFVWSSINTLAVDTHPEIRGIASSIVNSFKYFSFSLSPLFYGVMYQARGIEYAFFAASVVTSIQFFIMVLYSRYKRSYQLRHV